MTKLWKCRFCGERNVMGCGCCSSCGQAFIPNLQQILHQQPSTPQFPIQAGYTPLHSWKGWGKGKGNSWWNQGGKAGFPGGKGGGGGNGNGFQQSWNAQRQAPRQTRPDRDAAYAAELLQLEKDMDVEGVSAAGS